MKRILIAMTVLLLVAAGAALANETERYPWSAGIVVGGGTGDGDALASLGASVSREVAGWLDLGISLTAFSKTGEHPEDEVGRSYHLESGYGALLLRPKLQLTDWMELALPIETGSGTLIYRYDREYAEELRWDDEMLDVLTYGYYSIGLEGSFRLGERYAASIAGGYQTTSPLRTDLAESNELTGPWGRVGVSYRF